MTKKSLHVLLLLISLFAGVAFAQTEPVTGPRNVFVDFDEAGESQEFDQSGTGFAYHRLKWNWLSGTISGCAAELEGTTDGGDTWDPIITIADCSTDGKSDIEVGVYGRVRINLGTFAGTSSPSIRFEYLAAVTSPEAGAASGAAANGAAVSGNPVMAGHEARSTLPSAVDDGDVVRPMSDLRGRSVVLSVCPIELIDQQTTQLTDTNETTIVTAVASERHHIIAIDFTSATATAVTVTVKDSTGGTTQAAYNLAASGGLVRGNGAGVVLKQKAAVNNNWTATLSAGSITVTANVLFCKEL